MMLRDQIHCCLDRFRRDEAGAVTTDWVLLTSLVIGISVAATSVVWSNMGKLPDDIASTASAYEITTSFD